MGIVMYTKLHPPKNLFESSKHSDVWLLEAVEL